VPTTSSFVGEELLVAVVRRDEELAPFNVDAAGDGV